MEMGEIMNPNALLLIIRHALKNKTMVLISVLGLAISLTAVVLISLLVIDELGYDDHHANIDNIVRLEMYAKLSAEQEMNVAFTSAPIPIDLAAAIPEIDKFLRIKGRENVTVTCNNKVYSEPMTYTVDSTFFDFFSYDLIKGDPNRVLRTKDEAVITEAFAKKYFGDEDPIGKNILIYSTFDLTITGVMEDWNEKTHLPTPAFLISFDTFRHNDLADWLNSMNYVNYFLLNNNSDLAELTRKANDVKEEKIGDMIRSIGGILEFSVRPMQEIHLHSDIDYDESITRPISYIYQFVAIGAFILLIACLNFVNLSTATSSKRSKLVGICKTLGATRQRLFGQFILESILYAFIATLLALGLAYLLLPTFENMTGVDLNFTMFTNPVTILIFGLFSVVIGLLAGSYPALFLSSFEPVKVLKGNLNAGAKGSRLRSSLVVLQFVISITLITCSLLINSQMNFVRNKNLGFDKDQVLAMYLANEDTMLKSEAIKNEIAKLPGVLTSADGDDTPFTQSNLSVYHIPGRPETDQMMITTQRIGFDYIDAMGFNLIAGRDFDKSTVMDTTSSVIINERCAEILGYANPIDAVGGTIDEIEDIDPIVYSEFNIVGVISNFHYESLRSEIKPMMFMVYRQFPSNLFLKIDPSRTSETIAGIEEIWKSFAPGLPFKYDFLDDAYAEQYRTEQMMGRLFKYFTALAVFIAAIGLFALSIFAAEQRTSEIGIRKVLGASTKSIIVLLTKEFIKLVIIANVLAVPFVWYFMSKWLSSFAYKIEITPWVFVLATLASLIIALSTVSFQAIKAAYTNPIKSIKYE
jgi:putative ABC transport system permease protein